MTTQGKYRGKLSSDQLQCPPLQVDIVLHLLPKLQLDYNQPYRPHPTQHPPLKKNGNDSIQLIT